ncbi:MAG TPA: carboxypeptidase-like regulatory domain-containing protein [bacterium]|nr:carboxypeptidase-like regulatory domain-containing protein [bacterium]
MRLAGSILVALVVLAAGCDIDHEQKFWSVEGYVRDLSRNPVEGATIQVDIDRPVAWCCPSPQWWPCEFVADFSVRTDHDGHYLVCLDAADARTTIRVSRPGYCFDFDYADFERTKRADKPEAHNFWGHAGRFYTIEGYLRNPDGTAWTVGGWEMDLRETQGRWFEAVWSDPAHYLLNVPECDLTFEVTGPAGCDGKPQVKRYQGIHRDFHDQDFTVGCRGVQPEEYALYSALIQKESIDPLGSQVGQVVVLDRTSLALVSETDPRVIADYIQQHMPGVSDDMATDFAVSNTGAYPIESRFTLSVPVALLSAEQLSEILHDGGWELFHQDFPQAPFVANLSRVGFNASGDRALVYYSTYCGYLCGGGDFYLMTKANGTWSVENHIPAWTS